MNYISPLILLFCLIPLIGCQQLPPEETISNVDALQHTSSAGRHLGQVSLSSYPALTALKPITHTTFLPRPGENTQLQLYTFEVKDTPLQDLLFSLAQDTQLNIDIDPDINPRISLNANKQTLPQLLERIASLTKVHYEILGDHIRISKDTPFIRSYRVDHLNMSRTSESSVNLSAELNANPGVIIDKVSNHRNARHNNSQSNILSVSSNQFWKTLTNNIGLIISEERRAKNKAKHSSSNPNIIVNKETGILAVRTNRHNHRKVQAFISEVLHSSQRQVLIEATIAEITLSTEYEAGVDWNQITTETNFTNEILSSKQSSATQDAFFTSHNGGTPRTHSIANAIASLSKFGDVNVLSSPKVMTLNNQTALLKVVDNVVYFHLQAGATLTQNAGITTDFTTVAKTVPVGFVMAVTPYISEHNEITLDVRPTISRIIGHAKDPNPELAKANIVSIIPIIQVREVASILRVNNKEIAVIGGLTQNQITQENGRETFLNKIPLLGRLFNSKTNLLRKTELVIFIRPVVMTHASFKNPPNGYPALFPTPLSQSHF